MEKYYLSRITEEIEQAYLKANYFFDPPNCGLIKPDQTDLDLISVASEYAEIFLIHMSFDQRSQLLQQLENIFVKYAREHGCHKFTNTMAPSFKARLWISKHDSAPTTDAEFFINIVW